MTHWAKPLGLISPLTTSKLVSSRGVLLYSSPAHSGSFLLSDMICYKNSSFSKHQQIYKNEFENLEPSKYRSCHQRCSITKVFFEISQKFTGKHLCQSLLFNQVVIKKETLAQAFSVNFAKFLRIPFSQNTAGRLLL